MLINPIPTIGYFCPACENPYYESSMISGNTFGATFYTDGRMNAPMLSIPPWATKCPKCNVFLHKHLLQRMKCSIRLYPNVEQPKELKEQLKSAGHMDTVFHSAKEEAAFWKQALKDGFYYPPYRVRSNQQGLSKQDEKKCISQSLAMLQPKPPHLQS